MASDIFVYWKRNKKPGALVKPSRKQVLQVIQQFFGENVAKARWDQDRFFVELPGGWSAALRGVAPCRTAAQNQAAKEQVGGCRWIEVFIGMPQQHSAEMDVITRFADDYTNACAFGLAKVFALGWDGTLEMG